LNHDGTLLASGSVGGGRAFVWDVASRQTTWKMRARWVGLSRDGAWIAYAHGGLVVGPVGGTQVSLDTRVATVFAFDPENATLLAVTDGEVTEYLLPSGVVAARYPKELVAVGFSRDGRSVIGQIGDDVLRWPDRSAPAVMARARRAVYRSLTEAERVRFEMHRPVV